MLDCQGELPTIYWLVVGHNLRLTKFFPKFCYCRSHRAVFETTTHCEALLLARIDAVREFVVRKLRCETIEMNTFDAPPLASPQSPVTNDIIVALVPIDG